MKTLFAVLALVALSISNIATAADAPIAGITVDAPTMEKGDVWTMTTGATETFLRVEGDALVFYREDKNFLGERYRTRDMNLMYDIKDGSQINTRRPHSGLLSFPMYIGKSWGMAYEHKGVWRKNSYEVVAYEKIETEAGTFDAFRIEGLDKREFKPYGIKMTIWYAPAAKTIVKMTGDDETNHQGVPGWSFELRSHK